MLLVATSESRHLPQGFSLIGLASAFAPKELPAALPFAFTTAWWFDADDHREHEQRLAFVAPDESVRLSSETYRFKATGSGRLAFVTVEHREAGHGEWTRAACSWPLLVTSGNATPTLN